MSLLWYRHRITRAVAGDLSGREELQLRRHLTGCEACRAHYDNLTMVARAARGELHGSTLERERALSRLLEGLPTGEALRRRWATRAIMASALALGVALIFFVSRPPAAQVQYRGGPTDAPGLPSIRVYAKARAGQVRLVADLPVAGEARVAQGELVQFKLQGAAILSGQLDDQAPQVFDPAQSVTLEAGRWRLFIQATPLAEKQPAGVLWVE